jgi:hypothetical protein
MHPGILHGGGLEKTTLSTPPARTDGGRTRRSVVMHGNHAMGDRLWLWHYCGVNGYRDGHPLASYVDPTSLSCQTLAQAIRFHTEEDSHQIRLRPGHDSATPITLLASHITSFSQIG